MSRVIISELGTHLCFRWPLHPFPSLPCCTVLIGSLLSCVPVFSLIVVHILAWSPEILCIKVMCILSMSYLKWNKTHRMHYLVLLLMAEVKICFFLFSVNQFSFFRTVKSKYVCWPVQRWQFEIVWIWASDSWLIIVIAIQIQDVL
jgi:hypothetical protein